MTSASGRPAQMLGNIAFLFFSSDGRNVGDKLFEDDNITLGKKKRFVVRGNSRKHAVGATEFSRVFAIVKVQVVISNMSYF